MQLVFSQSKTQKTLSFFWCISHGPSHPIVCLLPVLLQTGDWHRRCCILIRKAGRHPLSPVMSLFWQLLMMFLFLFLFLVTVANPVVQPCSAETLLLWTYRDLGSKMRKTNQTIPFACGLSELSIGINRELDFCSSCQLSWGWGLHTSGVLLQLAKQCGSSPTWDVHPGAIFIGLSLGLVFDWHWWPLIFKWDILGLWKREILWYDGLILDHGPCWIWISPYSNKTAWRPLKQY